VNEARKRVVIVGAGFGGLAAARALAAAPADVLVIDRRNHHLFQPLLYQVATAALNPADIAAPIRKVLRRQRNTSVILAEATGVDLAARKVVLTDGEVPFDFLILATGATHSYFGNDGYAKHAPGLKTIEDALEIRRRVLLAYEAAEREDDPARRREWLTFAIVGGGPTGVELAGALAEIARHALSRDFRRINPSDARIVLIEGQGRVLAGMAPDLSEKAAAQLAGIGVEIRCSARVTGIDDRGVSIGAERIAARTVLWAAGVAASPLAKTLGVPLDRAGRVPIQPNLTISGHPTVYVIGDLAVIEQDGKPVTGLAPIAIQEGRLAAGNIIRTLRGQPVKPFRYRDKGVMATIGRAKAVADMNGLKMAGFFAWMAWLFIHILYLIGFRNRLVVMFSWAWVYVTYDRGSRLITGDTSSIARRRDESP
jgi:NADH dehydrogenase